MNKDYEFMSLRNPRTVNHYTSTGSAMSIAANRISYVFDLTGPSLAIDTACSSSLVALYYAFLAIKQGIQRLNNQNIRKGGHQMRIFLYST